VAIAALSGQADDVRSRGLKRTLQLRAPTSELPQTGSGITLLLVGGILAYSGSSGRVVIARLRRPKDIYEPGNSLKRLRKLEK
jgi:LPXTG-motif cell wall-anchored protein